MTDAHSARPVVAVCGPGREASEQDRAIAREVGFLLASRGATVVTGGLDGVMAAASEGAREGGGTAVGLLPGSDPTTGNAHLSFAIPTGLGEMRNALLIRSAQAVIAISGSWGTLSEVALAQRTGTPLVWVRGWTLQRADGTTVDVARANTAAEAVDWVFASLAGA